MQQITIMLHFVNYRKRYGAVTILEIPEFSITGGICWVKGANRAGKSTLLKSIGGLIGFEGDIVLDQHVNLHKHPEVYRQRVNFADAEPLFPEFLTGQEMIGLFSDAKGGTSHQAAYWIDRFHMHSYLQQPVGTYSSGMLKKLSITLAFIGNARLILLDEPCITLDAGALQALYTGIAEHHRQHNTGFLISSHQPLDIDGLTPARHLLVENGTLTFQP
jgi:ABC-2 type transport system ATP-binding protein